MLALFATGVPAFAQDKFEVEPDGIAVVKRGLSKDTVKDARADHGTVVVSDDKSGAALIYMAPADVRDLDVKITYKIGDAQQLPIEVSVRPRAPTLNSPMIYDASFKALFVLFILAVLVENGLALVFRWRPYLDFLDTRTTNAFVAFVFSLILVRLFNLDIASQLIGVYTGAKPLDLKDWMGWPGSILTAMIIAGGSAGVNRVFQSFGFRPTSAQEAPPPPHLADNQAWVSVTLLRDQAVGSADVLIKDAVAGTISGTSSKQRFLRYFIRDKGRFPPSGGYTVTPGPDYTIGLQASKAGGAALPRKTWGPYTIAPRAIIDIEMKV
ncbi:MAG TPA: hypothetical protein VNU00_07760 [Candidatus Binataceae bacterium]|nr:hypothetical protein [Candidatus Binataceae bacterium]